MHFISSLSIHTFLSLLRVFPLKVQMHNGDVYEANIKDIDKKSDIATIKINPQVSGGSQAALRCPLAFWRRCEQKAVVVN